MTAKAKDVMTPAHPRWEEFRDRLSGPEGCNFRRKPDGSATWKCAGGTDKTLATKILKAMGMDIAGSLAYFEAHGGYCDCEILFNVEATHPGPVCRAAGQAARPASPIPLASERSRVMSKEIKVGQSYQCKVGRNSVEVTVLNTCDGGWEVATASGKRLTIKDAARLSALAAVTAEGGAQAAPGAKTRGKPPKAAKTPKARKKGLVGAAIEVLRETGHPMNTQEMVDAVLAKGLWKSDGKTPAATLYSSILREIQKKGDDARFVKTERGKFALKP